MVAVSSISPQEVMSYNSRNNAAGQNLLNSKATVGYQRALQGIQYGQNVGDFERGANRARVQIPWSFANRNALHSGAYMNALSQYAVDRTAGLRNIQNQYQINDLNSILSDRSAEDTYANTAAQTAAEQYARQAQLAAMLRENS
jgi:hypothetical protein